MNEHSYLTFDLHRKPQWEISAHSRHAENVSRSGVCLFPEMELPVKGRSFLVSSFTVLGDSACWKHCHQYAYKACHFCLRSEVWDPEMINFNKFKVERELERTRLWSTRRLSMTWWIIHGSSPFFFLDASYHDSEKLRVALQLAGQLMQRRCEDMIADSLACNDLFQENNNNPISPRLTISGLVFEVSSNFIDMPIGI